MTAFWRNYSVNQPAVMLGRERPEDQFWGTELCTKFAGCYPPLAVDLVLSFQRIFQNTTPLGHHTPGISSKPPSEAVTLKLAQAVFPGLLLYNMRSAKLLVCTRSKREHTK